MTTLSVLLTFEIETLAEVEEVLERLKSAGPITVDLEFRPKEPAA